VSPHAGTAQLAGRHCPSSRAQAAESGAVIAAVVGRRRCVRVAFSDEMQAICSVYPMILGGKGRGVFRSWPTLPIRHRCKALFAAAAAATFGPVALADQQRRTGPRALNSPIRTRRLWSRLVSPSILTGTYLATRQAVPDMLAGAVRSNRQQSRVTAGLARAPLTFRRMRARSMQSSA